MKVYAWSIDLSNLCEIPVGAHMERYINDVQFYGMVSILCDLPILNIKEKKLYALPFQQDGVQTKPTL
jgi:hypothetical protein